MMHIIDLSNTCSFAVANVIVRREEFHVRKVTLESKFGSESSLAASRTTAQHDGNEWGTSTLLGEVNDLLSTLSM